LHLEKLLKDINPLIKNASNQANQKLAFLRKAEATGRSIKDVMNDIELGKDHEEIETDPEDNESDRAKSDFNKMVGR
jgi:hypothetical protein